MITFSTDIKVYIYNDVVDMRKSINGLVLLVCESLSLDPQAKALYLFRNKLRDKVKAVLWDTNGFILLYKRLEKEKFKFPKHLPGSHYEIDTDLLQWLLKGFDFYALKQHPELKCSQYF